MNIATTTHFAMQWNVKYFIMSGNKLVVNTQKLVAISFRIWLDWSKDGIVEVTQVEYMWQIWTHVYKQEHKPVGRDNLYLSAALCLWTPLRRCQPTHERFGLTYCMAKLWVGSHCVVHCSQSNMPYMEV